MSRWPCACVLVKLTPQLEIPPPVLSNQSFSVAQQTKVLTRGQSHVFPRQRIQYWMPVWAHEEWSGTVKQAAWRLLHSGLCIVCMQWYEQAYHTSVCCLQADRCLPPVNPVNDLSDLFLIYIFICLRKNKQRQNVTGLDTQPLVSKRKRDDTVNPSWNSTFNSFSAVWYYLLPYKIS